MYKLKTVWKKAQITLMLIAFVFLVMLASLFIVFFLFSALIRFIPDGSLPPEHLPVLLLFGICSLIGGTIIAALTSRLPLKPFRTLMKAVDRIAVGDYSVRLDLRGPEDFRALSRSFNHMAAELGSVEILRSDFINDFSHEFKTPIVSIRGFANMLLLDDLSEEERREYLEIIVQESERLSDLSSRILALSRVEKQTILTDQTTFNVTEQIRRSIALLDSKWSKKDITFQFDCGEYTVFGNEDLLQQVWTNLLDNAVKFSPEGETVRIEIRQREDELIFTIANRGDPLSPETTRHLFDKFYQGDSSHTTPGNGLGLTLVKKIVELHRGQITVSSEPDGWIVFTVSLPGNFIC